MKTIAVYCGSSSGHDNHYHKTAEELGKHLAVNDIRIIFGGGKVGLMGVLADSALKEGGTVIGIIPRFLHVKEVVHGSLSELITVETMHERKSLIEKMSDAFIAMPGGFGTLDELFEMLTWGQLGIHQKPVGILNPNGFFDPFLTGLDHMVKEGFLKQQNRDSLLIAPTPQKILGMLNGHQPPANIPKWIR